LEVIFKPRSTTTLALYAARIWSNLTSYNGKAVTGVGSSKLLIRN
jgi:hypothetical protein